MSAPYACDPKPLQDRLARLLDERRTVTSELAQALRCALSVCAQESRVAETGLGLGQSLISDIGNHATIIMADRVIRAITEGLGGLQAALDLVPAGVDPLLLGLLDDLADPDDCHIEADGHCEVHGWWGVQTCPQARLKQVLTEAGVGR